MTEELSPAVVGPTEPELQVGPPRRRWFSREPRDFDPYERDEKGRATGSDVEAYKRFLEECETRATETFDREILLLDGGALGLSLVFLEKVVGTGPALHSWIVPWAWVALVLSMVVNLTSQLFTTLGVKRELACINRRRLLRSAERAGGPWRWFINSANWLALALCVVGIAILVIFASLNFERSVSDERQVKAPASPASTEQNQGGRSGPEADRERAGRAGSAYGTGTNGQEVGRTDGKEGRQEGVKEGVPTPASTGGHE